MRNGHLFFGYFLVFPADRSAHFHIVLPTSVPGEFGAAVGRHFAWNSCPPHFDPDLHLSKYGRRQPMVRRPFGRDDRGIFWGWQGNGEAKTILARRIASAFPTRYSAIS